jgi:hypothetical protein
MTFQKLIRVFNKILVKGVGLAIIIIMDSLPDLPTFRPLPCVYDCSRVNHKYADIQIPLSIPSSKALVETNPKDRLLQVFFLSTPLSGIKHALYELTLRLRSGESLMSICE